MIDRVPDITVTSDDLIAEGALIDPVVYGPHAAYRGRRVNLWTRGVLELMRDCFASGQFAASWGVLANVMAIVLRDHERGEAGSPYVFAVPPDDPDFRSHPRGETIWLEPNERGGWTALLPQDHWENFRTSQTGGLPGAADPSA